MVQVEYLYTKNEELKGVKELLSGFLDKPLIGVAIWYTAAPWQRTKWDIALLVFVFILSSMSPSDLFPAYLRKEFVQPYALKALPVTIVWFKLCYEMLTKNYQPLIQNSNNNE